MAGDVGAEAAGGGNECRGIAVVIEAVGLVVVVGDDEEEAYPWEESVR